MNRKLQDLEFTIFDTETTGLNPGDGDRIVEIAAARFRNAQKIGEFSTLVNPQREISAAAFAVNHITGDMVRDAPTASEVLPRFMEFIKDSCLCSYNALFDVEFLRYELLACGSVFPEDIVVIDILKMARKLMPGLERYALWFVTEKLGITVSQKHRALSDVQLTTDVFGAFRAMLAQKGIDDFKSFAGLFSVNPALLDDLNSQKAAEIQEAIDKKTGIRIRYMATSTAAVTERIVIPRQIKQENKNRYLVGYCDLKKEERTFRLDHILAIELLP